MAGLHEFFDAGVELQVLRVHGFECRHRHAAQQCQAPAQAVLVVGDFTAHGGFGDGCNFGLAAGGGGDLVDTLDVDERGIHVERDELEVRQVQRRREAADEEAGLEFVGSHGVRQPTTTGGRLVLPVQKVPITLETSSRRRDRERG